MNFEYTYIYLFGFKVFEPTTLLTNLFIIVYSLYAYFKTRKSNNSFSKYWSMFFLLMATSCASGTLTHAVHEQLGAWFLQTSWFLMNGLSLISIYFFYRAAFSYYNLNKTEISKVYNYLVIIWIALLLLATLFLNNFLLIKIHAAIVLIYSLIVHTITYRNNHIGSGYIVAGILISFLSIVVHSLKLSVGEWFNYKDIAHLIMLTSLVYLHKGVKEGDLSITKLASAN